MNIYQNLYDLINLYVFNNTLVTGSYPELVTVLFSTLMCFLAVSLPIIVILAIIFWIIRGVFR